MTNRYFITAVAAITALVLLILLENVRDATAPVFGPPNVDKGKVMSIVESGALSFKEARFYAVEEAPSQPTTRREADPGSQEKAARDPARSRPVKERR